VTFIQNTDPTFAGGGQVPDNGYTNVAPKKHRRWPWIVAIVVALLVGGSIGASGKTKTNTVTKTETVTSIVTNNVTPAACATALDQADKLFTVTSSFATHAGAALTGASHGFTAIGNSDVAGIEAATTEITNAGAGIRDDTAQTEAIAPVYKSARDACTSP
jgi:hypothetical protein